MDVLFCDINSDSNKYGHQHRSYSACRGVPSGTLMWVSGCIIDLQDNNNKLVLFIADIEQIYLHTASVAG